MVTLFTGPPDLSVVFFSFVFCLFLLLCVWCFFHLLLLPFWRIKMYINTTTTMDDMTLTSLMSFTPFDRPLCYTLFRSCFKTCLLLFTFYLNGGLHEVSMGKPSEQMSNFWTVRFFKNRIRNRIRTEIRFSAHP